MKPIIRTILSTIFSTVLLLSISSDSIANVGPDGAFTGDYHYENESFARIEPYGTQGDGPSYWIETKPDGTN